MGTNYYLHVRQSDPCPHCGVSKVPDTETHIGKSSGGWCFALRVHPEDGIHDLNDWVERWPTGRIFNEYGEEISPEEMMAIITKRSASRRPHWWGGYYTSARDFYAKNHAEPGPNGLLRSQLDGRHCIKHGAGTWDCVVGEFS